MELAYWQRQTPEQPLFYGIEWNKPEQRSRAGQLSIIGSDKLGKEIVRRTNNAGEAAQ